MRRCARLSHRLHQLPKAPAALLEAGELIEAGTGRRKQHCGCASAAARATAASNSSTRSSVTAPDRSAAMTSAASPYTTAARQAVSSGASGAKGSPLGRPPRMMTYDPVIAWSATSAAETFVAFESLIHATSRTVATGSSRCGGGRNVVSPRAMCAAPTPALAAANAAASALATLWSPNSPNSPRASSGLSRNISHSASRSNQASVRSVRLQ